MRTCSISGCGRSVVGRGWCDMHYRRWKRRGDPLDAGPQLGAPYAFVEAAIGTDTDCCIIWPFPTNNSGYGGFSKDGKSYMAHRYVCEKVHGKPPELGLEAAHSCNVRTCLNWRHLRWATTVANEADKEHHGTKAIGERHGISKLTREQVREIRALGGTMLQRNIAQLYNICQSRVSVILLRKEWKWLE